MKKILLLTVMMFAVLGFTMAQAKPHHAPRKGAHRGHHKVHHHHPRHHHPHPHK